MLEAVKEYNVSGTSSEDSAESDDLERLPAAAEGTVYLVPDVSHVGLKIGISDSCTH